MDKFAFIVHPFQIKDIHDYFSLSKIIPSKFLRNNLKIIPPTVYKNVKVTSVHGDHVEGYLIFCPLFPEQFKNYSEEYVNKKILSSVKYAEKLGVKIIGLGAYTSVVGDKGITIAKHSSTAITTGNSYTVWLTVNSCVEAAKKLGLNLSNSKICIIGATGSIGSACTKLLSKHFNNFALCSPNKEKLNCLSAEISNNNSNVLIYKNPQEASNNADIIIIATSSPKHLIKTSEIKNNSILCDVSMPPNVLFDDKTKNITFIKGGLAKMPLVVDFGLHNYIPRDTVFACIAETIILTFEKRFENFSLGGNLPINKINEIGNMGTKYGFKPYLKTLSKI